MFVRNLMLGIALGAAPLPLAAQAGLEAPPGFVVELIAEAPAVLWPSCVLALRDGSILVGEDPMDMPGPAHLPIDRIVRWRRHTDGTWEKSPFAENLFAVFGLLEIEDAVYCMNMPHLTVLRDLDGDGRAETREVLIDNLGIPPPGADKGFNDHIVSGLQFGMDGRIYVAVGDKGIPRAVGRDGSTVTLRGGGIVRLRPDGTELEIVARGLRNILEPCLDAEDELFTYDNTDDGRGWWTRFTHVIPGGDYGYPWSYQKHQERHLPCLGDCGGGSPTGGAAYREAAWPALYHGDIFFCDWADRVVRRFEVERRGATFALLGHSDFLREANDKSPFHPTDLAFSVDGREMYVADWNFGGWQKPDERGRLFLVRQTGAKPEAPPPPLSTVQECLAALEHPAYAVRREAQSILERSDPSVASELEAQLRTSRSEPARRHAVWAWANLQRTAKFPAQLPPLPEASPALQAQVVRALGHRDAGPWPTDPRVLRAALEAAQAGPPLKPALFLSALSLPEGPLRFLARALTARQSSALELLKLWREEATRAEAALTTRLLDRAEVVIELAQITQSELQSSSHADARMLVPLLSALADLHRRPAPWDGRWWGIGPADDPPPPHTEAWAATEAVAQTLAAAIRHADPRIAASARDAICETAAPDLLHHVLAFAGELPVDDEARLPLLIVFARARFAEAKGLFLAALLHRDAAHRLAGLAGLRAVDARDLAEAGRRLTNDPDVEVRRSALRLAAAWNLEGARAILLAAAASPDLRVTAFDGLAQLATEADAPLLLEGLADSHALVRARARDAVVRLGDRIRPALERQAGRISPAVLYTLQSVFARSEPLREWRLLGPIPKLEASAKIASATAADQEFAPAWTTVSALGVDGRVDLTAHFGRRNDVHAYASTTIESSSARNLTLAVGSDDDVTIWLNGERVHDHQITRGWRAGQDSVPIRLVAGRNDLALRIGQGYGDWAFSVAMPAHEDGPLFARAGVAPPRARLRAAALNGGGDPARGRALFRDRKSLLCSSCHIAEGFGLARGPDLSDLGTKSPLPEILDSVLEPSQRILDGYRETGVELKDGSVLFGLFSELRPGYPQLTDAEGEEHLISPADLVSKWTLNSSAMPDGLVDALSPESFADLIAYLQSLKP